MVQILYIPVFRTYRLSKLLIIIIAYVSLYIFSFFYEYLAAIFNVCGYCYFVNMQLILQQVGTMKKINYKLLLYNILFGFNMEKVVK